MKCPDGTPPEYLPLPSRCIGSFPGPSDACCAAELSGHPNMRITIPDGVDAGTYRPVVWNGTVWQYTLSASKLDMACIAGSPDTLKIWVHSVPGTKSAAIAVVCSPFLATFPGTLFGSSGNITVELNF